MNSNNTPVVIKTCPYCGGTDFVSIENTINLRKIVNWDKDIPIYSSGVLIKLSLSPPFCTKCLQEYHND